MRILYITRAYSTNRGGMERLSYELARALQRLPNTSVDVIAHRGSRAASLLHNFACLPAALRHARSADIILIGDPVLSFAGWLLNNLFGKPVAVIVHGLDITYTNLLYQAYLKLFFISFQLYLPISQYVNTLLEQKSLLGTRVIVTPGITDRFYSPNIGREQLAKLLQTINYKLQTSAIVLLTVGRLIERKGHAWFISRVFLRLPNRVHLIIAGTGPEQSNIRRAAAAHGLNERVHLLGRVTDDQLKILYNSTDAYIQPNIPVNGDPEGFGLVLLEAALCNRPVFAARLEGIPDAIHDGQNGLLLAQCNADAWVSTLTKFINRTLPLPAHARNYTLAKFNWQCVGKTYLTALARALRTYKLSIRRH